ncbi:cytochrome p450 domain-containing protein [Phthorimaea operculella]|nr:cytochrome p450 domain-containing protein [Phthorimaea operculella]
MWLLYVCVLLCVVGLCVYYPWWIFRRARKMLAHLPSYVKYPLVGNIHLLMGKGGEYFLHQISIMSRMMDVYLSPFVFWVGPLPCVLFSAPEDVKTVSMAYPDKASQYRISKNVFGDGLISGPGKIWKYTSKKLSVAWSSPVVAGYQHIFNDHSRKLVEQLKTESDKEPFDACKKYINWMSLQSIYYATFGVPNTSEHGVTKEYSWAYEQVLKKYCKRSIMIHQYSDFIYSLTSDSKETAEYENMINSQAERIISHRRKERKLEKSIALTENQKEENEGASFKPYIDILLDLNETDPVFSHRQIISELNSIIGAGHDTVANTLTMCFIMLGTYSDVQDKLYDEMKTVFGDSKRPVTKEDLAAMPYCEAVINETLRLYPAVPLGFRRAHRDLELKNCTIPEGTMCGINIWGSLRSKPIWGEDAEVFHPERWLEPDFNPFFIPFSYGKRTCVGKRYAMAMLKTALAHCSRELEFKANTLRLRMRSYVTLKAFGGHHIQVSRREIQE